MRHVVQEPFNPAPRLRQRQAEPTEGKYEVHKDEIREECQAEAAEEKDEVPEFRDLTQDDLWAEEWKAQVRALFVAPLRLR